ncbi:hypothetical protein M3649_03910 [Ureibacillus chungkukjangi]|uniref:hypothetical protein n=1 Tax=Ureibacillus chungkukjangi TaxID=1202712 RepID=UPI00203C95C5|nr:hypothetical protein [Ureibacillus chungkukjangi]MCM3387277.1 hypothetical protein [Ureibacillus chungkukjangi]
MDFRSKSEEEIYDLLTIKELKVSKKGDKKDYFNLPFTKNDIPVGVVVKADDLEDGYELTIRLFKDLIWNSVTFEDKVKSVSIDYVDLHNKKSEETKF